jgi:hypothetical protein
VIDEIICIGTSFTEGAGLNPTKGVRIIQSEPAVIWYKENKGIEINSITEYSWPTQLQKLSGIKTRNLGKCGSSIEYLMRNVEEIIETEDCSNKFFILEYSSWGRSELWSTKHNQWIVANWGPSDGNNPDLGYSVMMSTDYNFGIQLESDDFKIYESFLDNYFNEHAYLIKRDRDFLNLLHKLNYKNIKYQIILLENPYLIELVNHELFNYKNILDKNMWGYIENDVKLSITKITNGEIEDGHPSIEGHQHISELIYTKLKEQNRL